MRRRIFFKLMLAFVLVIGVSAVTLELVARAAWERTLR